MANTAPAPGSVGPVSSSQAVERLRSLTGTDVTIVTRDGEISGSVLSCTRSSVWLVGSDDLDVVVQVADILEVIARQASAA